MTNPATAPVATSFSLSILLHGAALAVLLPLYEQVTATGRGLEIELVSSTQVSQQQETDEPRQQETSSLLENISTLQRTDNKQQEQEQERHLASPAVVTSRRSVVNLAENTQEDNEASLRRQDAESTITQQFAAEGNSSALLRQSTNAVMQQHALLELLHDSISSNKAYPYIARRQRREGVATVSFILHPDGNIEDAHVVTSSRTSVLDHAALTAVQRIAPFIPAQDYLDHAEVFSIDVVFDLL